VQVPYWSAFRVLGGVHLEVSRVLSVVHGPRALLFDLVVVLSPSHPLYRGPQPGEDHDYRRAQLNVAADHVVVHSSRRGDLGGITSWLVDDAGWSDLAGPWGRVRAAHASVTLTFADGD
jgi:hypothetical protein